MKKILKITAVFIVALFMSSLFVCYSYTVIAAENGGESVEYADEDELLYRKQKEAERKKEQEERKAANTVSGKVKFLIVGAVLVTFVSIIIAARKKNTEQLPKVNYIPEYSHGSEYMPLSGYSSLHSDFDREAFENGINRLIDCYFRGITEGNIDSLSYYVKESLFEERKKKLERNTESGNCCHAENIVVSGLRIKGYYPKGEEDRIVVYFKLKGLLYTINESGEVIEGDRDNTASVVCECEFYKKSTKEDDSEPKNGEISEISLCGFKVRSVKVISKKLQTVQNNQ